MDGGLDDWTGELDYWNGSVDYWTGALECAHAHNYSIDYAMITSRSHQNALFYRAGTVESWPFNVNKRNKILRHQ